MSVFGHFFPKQTTQNKEKNEQQDSPAPTATS
jgi:hypothetical protein